MENSNSTSHPFDAYLQSFFDKHLQSIREVFREEIANASMKELQEKLLSGKEVCGLFSPRISLPTLTRWSDQGLIKKYSLGGKVFYKYGEVMESMKSIKKFSMS